MRWRPDAENLRAWLPVLLWTAVVLWFSADGFSAARTSRYIDPVLR